MSDRWSPSPGRENAPFRGLGSLDLSQQDPFLVMSTQSPNIARRADDPHTSWPSQTLAIPVELAQLLEDRRSQMALSESIQQSQHSPQAFTAHYESLSQTSFSLSGHSTYLTDNQRAPSQPHSTLVRANETPQRFSSHPSGSTRSQSRARARLGTPDPSCGPSLPSPNRHRGPTRFPSAGPTGTSLYLPSASSQPMSSERQATSIQQGVGHRSQLHRNTERSLLALQAHIQSLSDRIYKEGLARYITQHSIRIQDIHTDVLANFKNHAFGRAHQMRYQEAVQRNSGAAQQASQVQETIQMLSSATTQRTQLPEHAPTFDGQNSPEPASADHQHTSSGDTRGYSPSTNYHIVQEGTSAHNWEDSSQMHSTQGASRRSDSPQALNQNDTKNGVPHTNRLQMLKGLLNMAIKTANNAYANRGPAYEKFQQYYPQLQQNVLNSAYALLAGLTGLDQLATQIWIIGDEQLFLLIQRVSIRLKQALPTLRKSIANVLGNIIDPELRWTATSRSLEMFYNSFSSLKACLKTRDEKDGDDRQIFVNALALDRAHVWNAFTPVSDDDLDGSLAAEQAVYQAQTVENRGVAQREWEAIQAQPVQQAFQAVPNEGA